MARRSTAAATESLAPGADRAGVVWHAMKQFLMAVLVLAGLLGIAWAYLSVEEFIVTDSRFYLAGPPDPGLPSEFFRIEGARNVTEAQVIEVFARDFNRSIYLCPLKDRRLSLMGLDWVKDASVSRFWPNRLVVRITERTPAAAVQMPAADGTMLLSLVDVDGVLLDPRRTRQYRLPVLTGMTRKEGEASRRERMKRFLRMQAELGGYMDKISEIDVSDLDNLKAIQPFDNRALTLMLGNQSYRDRYENFLHNQEDIRKRLPYGIVLDLRLPDRITAVGSAPPAVAAKPGMKPRN